MFSSDKAILGERYYFYQRDLLLKLVFCLGGMFTILDLLRSQVPEVNLLQLVPGAYFFFLLTIVCYLLYFSTIYIRTTYQYEDLETGIRKANQRLNILLAKKFSFFLFYWTLGFVLFTVIPVSLDSFSSSGEKTLENVWSLSDVVGLEIGLLTILLILSQLPILYIARTTVEKIVKIIPRYWKTFSFCTFIAAGILTPTLDGYTQVSFAFSIISVYAILIFFIQRRLKCKTISAISFI